MDGPLGTGILSIPIDANTPFPTFAAVT